MKNDNQRRNIVLCADGTGNRGGYTPDSNVYRIYKAVARHDADADSAEKHCRQLIYYDNGVGTNTNKILRAVSGAFGLGFGRNVCDLYKFLARNYRPGDAVYLFGFSRGASTIRAFNGFVHSCGLVNGNSVKLSNRELDNLVDEAFRAYRWARVKDRWLTLPWWRPKKGQRDAETLQKSTHDNHGVIDIHFTGIWDTVVALGFPKRTEMVTPVSMLLKALFGAIEKGADLLFPHSFYNYRLTKNQLNAYQALAIDDARTAFWPYVWDERDHPQGNVVEQVWFAGMHSNVGGGYNRSGMASVALSWMMTKATQSGLELTRESVDEAGRDAHVHGRMYDSRDGLAAFYRYHPRDIEQLCASKIPDQQLIRLHDSVIQRVEQRTANYAPALIPGRFAVVKDIAQPDGDITVQQTELAPQAIDPAYWEDARNRIDSWISWRKRLYDVMVTLAIAVVAAAIYLWQCPPQFWGRSGIMGDIADVLEYILPKAFSGLVEVAVSQNPGWFFGFIILLVVLNRLHKMFKVGLSEACQDQRKLVLKARANIHSETSNAEQQS